MADLVSSGLWLGSIEVGREPALWSRVWPCFGRCGEELDCFKGICWGGDALEAPPRCTGSAASLGRFCEFSPSEHDRIERAGRAGAGDKWVESLRNQFRRIL